MKNYARLSVHSVAFGILHFVSISAEKICYVIWGIAVRVAWPVGECLWLPTLQLYSYTRSWRSLAQMTEAQQLIA